MAEPPSAPRSPTRAPDDDRSAQTHQTSPGSNTNRIAGTAPASRSADLPHRSAPQAFQRRSGQLIVGRLQEHGRASYQFRPAQDLSYYVRVLTSRGVRVLWGKDLERALRSAATQPKIGDLIGVRRTGREAITLVDRTRDADGRVLTQSEHHAHRNRWEVEKLQFFSERARRARLARDVQLDARDAVRKHPELRSTFLSLRAAEELAAKRIANPQDRERFLTMVREAINSSTQRGEPLPDIALRTNKPLASRPSVKPRPKREREDPTR